MVSLLRGATLILEQTKFVWISPVAESMSIVECRALRSLVGYRHCRF